MLDLQHLPNQQPDEKTVLFLRPFWFTVLGILLGMALLYAVPLAIIALFWSRLSVWLESPLAGPVCAVVAFLYVATVWLFAYLQWVDYYLDTWIVTSERIISNEQHGLFSRTASELHLASVQDVTSEVIGFLPTFFNFGNVYVQTAGEKEHFVFENVPNPEKVKEIVIDLVDADKQRHYGKGPTLDERALM